MLFLYTVSSNNKLVLGNGGGFSRLEFSDQYQSGRQRKFRILLIPAPAFRTCINDIDDTHSSVDDKYLIFRTLCMSGTPTAIKYPGVFFDVYQNIFFLKGFNKLKFHSGIVST